jgi:hypothetical protein
MTKDFIVRLPARFLKDASISSDARVLRSVIAAFADGKTGTAYVTGKKLQATLGWGRDRREKAQSELRRNGWLRLGWKRGARARFARRIYALSDPTSTVAQFDRSGDSAHLISDHIRSQVRSSIPTDLTKSEAPSTAFLGSDMTWT